MKTTGKFLRHFEGMALNNRFVVLYRSDTPGHVVAVVETIHGKRVSWPRTVSEDWLASVTGNAAGRIANVIDELTKAGEFNARGGV